VQTPDRGATTRFRPNPTVPSGLGNRRAFLAVAAGAAATTSSWAQTPPVSPGGRLPGGWPHGQVDKVGDEFGGPNGLCFSPDYKKLDVADTGAPRAIKMFDVDGRTLMNGRTFATLQIPGTTTPSAADGIRCDVDGNIWAGARPGVQVIAPTGEPLGMIRLPETCANVCFGGAKRNRRVIVRGDRRFAGLLRRQPEALDQVLGIRLVQD